MAKRHRKTNKEIRHSRAQGRKVHPLYSMWNGLFRTAKIRIASRRDNPEALKEFCEEWLDFDNFADWAIENKWVKGLCVSKISKTEPLSPSNCVICTYAQHRAKGRPWNRHVHQSNGVTNPLSAVWTGMKQRCLNPKSDMFHRYGGRGICICEEWIESFDVFADWMLAHGWVKGLTIDRIDNDGNYCPENCRIVTNVVNLQNRVTTKAWIESAKINIAKAAKSQRKPVICVETGDFFKSAAHAAAHVGSSSSPMYRALANNIECKGYHWRYVAKDHDAPPSL